MSASLILASGSVVRARLLDNAGIRARTVPSEVDERSIKSSMEQEGADWQDVALALAFEKARTVSKSEPKALVIGADQILVCDGQAFDKPQDLREAKSHLKKLSGRSHDLLTACVLVREGREIWRNMSRPKLTMRPLSAAFIDDYLKDVGEQALLSVGAYQLEGRGSLLFEKVEGDFFSILGLPLLELLNILRNEGLLPR